MSPEVKKLTDHLVALTAFISSPAHEGFIEARQMEIADVKERICRLPPDSMETVAVLNSFHGELECLQTMLSTFEEAARRLKARIDETVERENSSGATTRV